ncbi:MAG: adenylate kinase [Nitriliruptorales bacterium]|nr:adenylate kinase [Nitriliruptorales bacterium]
MRLVLLGPPGAGKGTQAKHIVSEYGIAHVSTGDIFRDNVRRATALGTEAKNYMDRGELAPDDVVIKMVGDRLAQDDCVRGFVLDGFPRTVPQALALEDELASQQRPLHGVLRLVVDDEQAVQRLLGRREAEGRADDAEDVIRHRLHEYHTKTEPLEFFYAERGLLRDVDGIGEIGEVTDRALSVLKGLGEEDA